MQIVTRTYASKKHKRRPDLDTEDSFGHHPDSEAIGGYYGIAWYEHFEDTETGEIYKVKCYDGVYLSKEAFDTRPGEYK